jgi:hypothetical protein
MKPSRRLWLPQATAAAAAAGVICLGEQPALAFTAHHLNSHRPTSTRTSHRWPLAQAVESEILRSSDIDTAKALGIDIPSGLRQTLLTNAHKAIHKRFWVVDNSGSMMLDDGHCLLSSSDNGDEECSRWDEVSETVECHIHLAAALGAPSEFRLLNPPKDGGPLIRGPQSVRENE